MRAFTNEEVKIIADTHNATRALGLSSWKYLHEGRKELVVGE